jgi:hypothetical protein
MVDKILSLIVPSDDELAALLIAAGITILLWEFVLKRPTRRWQGDASTLYSRVGSGVLSAGIVILFEFYGFINTHTMPWPILALEASVVTPTLHHVVLLWGAQILAWGLKRFVGIEINLKSAITGSEKLRMKRIRRADGKEVDVPEHFPTDHRGGEKTIIAPKTLFVGGERHEMAEEDREETGLDSGDTGVSDNSAGTPDGGAPGNNGQD